ncbi:MAG TPA: glycosyl hydrolase, partial [Candidatus Didemnitutus sp.]|nr:glycosyl hydrolase [Candidatus Didemnitutus sp.]
WTAQPDNLLGVPGKGQDDGVNGGHPGVVVSGDRAYVFYFTHPGRAGTIAPEDKNSLELRRSSIQVVELHYANGTLSCDRDAPTYIHLTPPTR